MKRFIAMLLLALTIFSCCATMTACGSSSSKKNHEYSYYTRSDGKRIWIKNR